MKHAPLVLADCSINSLFMEQSVFLSMFHRLFLVCENVFPDVISNVALDQLHIIPSSTIIGRKL